MTQRAIFRWRVPKVVPELQLSAFKVQRKGAFSPFSTHYFLVCLNCFSNPKCTTSILSTQLKALIDKALHKPTKTFRALAHHSALNCTFQRLYHTPKLLHQVPHPHTQPQCQTPARPSSAPTSSRPKSSKSYQTATPAAPSSATTTTTASSTYSAS